jgi:hypothetical protein
MPRTRATIDLPSRWGAANIDFLKSVGAALANRSLPEECERDT